MNPDPFVAIPQELKDRRQWVVWKLLPDEKGKLTKVPFNARTGEMASSNNPKTWSSYEEALAALPGAEGLGFVWSGDDPYVAIDLDACRDTETGIIAEWALDIVRRFKTYAELSPSGTGIHLICTGELPPDAWHKVPVPGMATAENNDHGPCVEMYSSGRYFTMSGRHLDYPARPIADGQEAIRSIQAQYAKQKKAKKAATSTNGMGPLFEPDGEAYDQDAISQRPDSEILYDVCRETKFEALWGGKWEGYYPSQSEADAALVGRIARFTGPNPARIDQLFRRGGLMRDKWDDRRGVSTYGWETITGMLSRMEEFNETVHRGEAANGKTHCAEASDPFVVNMHVYKFSQTLEEEALYGICGEVVRLVEPHTESHPAAILAAFLVTLGCMIGRQPHIRRDGARHAANEFACIVGTTSKGRKGTASRRVNEIMDHVDIPLILTTTTTAFTSVNTFLLGGLGSGEALIKAVEDPKGDDDALLGVHLNDKSPVAKRKLVYEEEFSRSLKVMRRDGSILSEILRQAWDGGTLAVRTKAKALVATNPHICILAHITSEELQEQMAAVDAFNGFANRFLWFSVRRSKSLPFGGGDMNVVPVAQNISQALSMAEGVERLEFDAEARRIWGPGGIYEMLTERPEGRLGAVTSRAEAHVTRLALLYALLDAAPEIRVEHLMGALAVWDYNERSCAEIFGGSLGDPYGDIVLEMLMEVYPGYLTRTQIRDKFNRNTPAGRLPKAMQLLVDQEKVARVVLSGDGRPTECFSATVAAFKSPTTGGITPLERARQLRKGA